MTTDHRQLHDIKDFAELSTDPRFVMLVRTMRVLQPTSTNGDVHHILRDAGKGEGWHECLNKMEELLLPPLPPRQDPEKPDPYTRGYQPPNKTGFDANNRP